MGKRKISCLPCRFKKVKCTGGIPCERCVNKNISGCVLPQPGAVGRPPKNGVVKRVNHSISLDQTCREFIFENVQKSNKEDENNNNNNSQLFKVIKSTNIIEYFFTNYCDRIARLLDQIRSQYSLNGDPSKKKCQISQSNSIQDLLHLFSLMSSGLVDLLLQKICQIRTNYYSEAKFVVIGLALDDTNSFFDFFQPVSVNPLKSLPTDQGLELIEYFFCLNPQSIIINKTRLIESYWADTVDPLLLSVIYGTAIYAASLLKNEPLKRWGASNKSERNLFLDYAHTLLQDLDTAVAAATTTTTTTTKEKEHEDITLSQFQAVVLLAIFESMFGFAKKGTSLTGFAYLMATRLGVFSNTPRPNQDAIDKELLRFTFWSAFQGTVRGCVELEQVPREILTKNEQQLPPVNIYASDSLRLDIMSGQTRLLKVDNYLVETFYINSVTAKLTCRILQILPHSKCNDTYRQQDFTPGVLSPVSKDDELKPIEFNYPCKDIRLGLQNILDEFKQFINKTKHTWSRLQEFNLELIHLAYSLGLVFLKEEYNSESSFRSFAERSTFVGSETSTEKDKLQLEKGLCISRTIVEKSLDFLEKTSNYCDEPSYVPRKLIMCCLDISSQLFMYSMKTDASDKTSHYQLNHILSILWRDDVWNDWPPAHIASRTIENFLKSRMPDQGSLFPYPSNALLDLLFSDSIC